MSADASSASPSALVLSGGGARTAYQAGVLHFLADTFPNRLPPIVTGAGMGGVNAALWSGADPTGAAADSLVRFWDEMAPADVFEARSIWDLVTQLVRHAPSENQSLLDLAPLRRTLTPRLRPEADGTLPGVGAALNAGRLRALALTTSRYATGRTITWTQTAPSQPEIGGWEDPRREAVDTRLTLDHVIASASLALLFPAVQIGGAWHGAGVGLLHPLAPALKLGAGRLLVVSTRPEASETSSEEAPEESSDPYPSPLQIASLLSNTLLLDVPEHDARTARPAEVVVVRPSTDLTTLADDLDVDVGATLGTTLRYLHAEETHLPDLLSVLLYAPAFIRRCLLLGYADAEREADRIARVLGEG